MNKTYPFYKVTVSYFNLADAENEHTESVTVFQEVNPISSRKKAIERFRSLVDIFEQGIKNGTVLKSINDIFHKEINSQVIPSLNFYFCENDNPDEDLVIFGTLLESMEERLLELTDECEFYHNNHLDHDGVEVLKDQHGEIYTILKDSLFHEEDLEYFKSK